MCRNIRTLFHFQPPSTDEEIRAAALQYVRKVSGTTRPSRANAAAFEAAVEEFATLTRRLIREGLVASGPPRTREREAARARARGVKRGHVVAPPRPPASEVSLRPDRVNLQPYHVAGPRAEAAFELWKEEISRLLPGVEVHHVGATSIPGSLTKGDLDICLRVPQEQFAAADATLAGRFARDAGYVQTTSYSSFKEYDSDPELGIQLVVAGGPEDFFLRLRDALRADPALVERLNTLRRRHAGGEMPGYRAEKDEFYQIVLGGGGDWS